MKIVICRSSYLKEHFITIVNGKWVFQKESIKKRASLKSYQVLPWYVLGSQVSKKDYIGYCVKKYYFALTLKL